jgi:hypothetical protein
MKIPSTTLTAGVQKLVETNKGYILNANYYSDVTKNIQGNLTFPMSSTDYKTMSLSRVKGRSSASFNNIYSEYKNYIVDNQDPTITYVAVSGDMSVAAGATFLKVQENADGSSTVLYSRATGVQIAACEIIWQNNDYFLMVGTTAHNSSTLYWVDKNSLVQTATTTANTFLYGYIKLLWEEPDFLYFLGRNGALNVQTLQIYTYNKATKTLVINQSGEADNNTNGLLPVRQMAAIAGFNVIDCVIPTGATTYTIYAGFLGTAATELKIRRILLDFSKTKGPALNANLDYQNNWCVSDTVFTYADTNIWYGNASVYSRYTLFPIYNIEHDNQLDQDVEKLYLGIGFAEGFASTTALNTTNSGVYIYQLNERTDYNRVKWTATGLIAGTGTADDGTGTAGKLVRRSYFNTLSAVDALREVFPITADNKFVALMYNSRIQIARFEGLNVQYELVKDLSFTPRIFGTDKWGYFYAISSDDTIPQILRINLLDTNSVNVELEKYQYSYTGSDIETFCTVYARDISNQPIEMTVDLVGSANVTFDDSNGQRVTVDIPADSAGIQVPFKITSAQVVEITPVAHV